MNKEIVKKAFSEAENALTERKKEYVKKVVERILERIEAIDEQIHKLQEERKLLKLDIDDLKQGHLDRIEERQRKDPQARQVSPIEVLKEIHNHYHYGYWTQPYVVKITGESNSPPRIPINYNGTSNDNYFTITASTVKDNAIGTYEVCGKIIHLR